MTAFLTSLILLLASFTQAQASYLIINNVYKGHFYSSAVTSAMLENAPKWRDLEKSPPLSPNDALAAAKTKLNKEVHTPIDSFNFPTDFRVRSVELRNVDDGWVYIVSFTPSSCQGRACDFRIIVLLDGTVVPLTNKKEL